MSLYDWRLTQCIKYNLLRLYYLTHISNLESILINGILPKNCVITHIPNSYSFAEETVQERRDKKTIELSNHARVGLHDLVPLYLTPRTPTLYARRGIQPDLCFLDVSIYSICSESNEFAFTDGNAGASHTSFFHNLYKLQKIPWEVIEADFWGDFDDGRRKRCSEFLVYPSINPQYIERLVVYNHNAYARCLVIAQRTKSDLDIFIDLSYFFHP